MMYSRGVPADYDDWAKAGLEGWSYADVLPYFRRSEGNWRGSSAFHGADGPLTVSRHVPDEVIYPRMMAAGGRLGFKQLDDFHAGDAEGFSVPDFNVHRGERASTSVRFLRPAMRRPNLTVITNALVQRVLLEGGRARGVEYRIEGRSERIDCGGEVVLAAGAFGSPQILMLSGIGPAAAIEPHGIRVIQDLPGVGANLQEHQSLAMMYRARGSITFDNRLRADRFAFHLLRWLLFRTGSGGGVAGIRAGIRADLARAGSAGPADAGESGVDDGQTLVPRLAGRCGVTYLRLPASCCILRAAAPYRCARLIPPPRRASSSTFCKAPEDRASFTRILHFARRFFATPEAQEVMERELLPGPAVQSDVEFEAFARANVRTAMHPTSTCAMGIGRDAVVDARLRVRGIDALRVADASVMPTIVGGNTNAPAIMIAEKAVDLLRDLPRGRPRPKHREIGAI